MDAYALTAKTVHDGPVCALIVSDLDLLKTGGFLEQSALAAGDQTGRLGSGLAGMLFPGCAAVRVLRIATRSAPGGCPVIGCPLSAMACRIVELLGWDLANLPDLSLGDGRRDGPRDGRTGQPGLVLAELGAPFPAGTEGCP